MQVVSPCEQDHNSWLFSISRQFPAFVLSETESFWGVELRTVTSTLLRFHAKYTFTYRTFFFHRESTVAKTVNFHMKLCFSDVKKLNSLWVICRYHSETASRPSFSWRSVLSLSFFCKDGQNHARLALQAASHSTRPVSLYGYYCDDSLWLYCSPLALLHAVLFSSHLPLCALPSSLCVSFLDASYSLFW